MLKDSSSSTLLDELAPADRKKISDIPRWRWVASTGIDLASPIDHPTHQGWIQAKGNTHCPAHREIMLPLHGNCVFGAWGNVYERSPGMVFLFDHHESRDWATAPHLETTSIGALWLHFFRQQHSLTFNTVARDSNGRRNRGVTRRILSADLVGRLMDAWDRCREHPCDRLQWALLKSLVTALLLEVLTTPAPRSSTSHQSYVIELTQQYILTHLAEDLSLDLLARIAGYSPFFFHRLFRQYAGMTPKEAIDKARLDRARQLLKEGYTVTATAEATGFRTPYSFSRFFKEKTGIAPKEWRSQATLP